MMKALIRIFMLFPIFGMVACATATPDRERASYFDSALNDRNRAPASMTPPENAANFSDRVDPVSTRTQADFHFSAGEAFSFEGLHSKAIESFRTVLVYDPNSVQVRLRLAAEYVKIGSMSEALRQAEDALKLEPKKIETHLLLGGLYSSLKDYNKAIQEYETVRKLDPKNSDALMYLGAVFAERKQYDRAIKAFETLANLDDYATPQTAYYYIGRIREEEGTKASLRSSELAYKKALSMKSDYAEAAVALAGFYVKQQKTSQAIDVLKRFQRDHGPNLRIADLLSSLYLQDEKYDLAMEQLEILESDPEETLNVKMKMALIFIDQKQFRRASVKLTEVLRVAPDSDKIRFYLAAVYEEMGEGMKAVEHFQKVPANSPYFQDSIVHAAYILKDQKRTDDALELMKATLEKRKDVPQFYAVYASLLDEKKDYDRAFQVLNEGVEKFADYVQLRFFLGTIYDRKGDREKSMAEMQKVIEMDPNHVQGLNYLAFTYADLGINLTEAETLVKRALAMEPKDGYILDTYGWILFKQNKLAESVRVLERASQAQPTESVILEHLGDVYYRSQLHEKARVMYEKAIETAGDQKKIDEIRMKITTLEQQEMVGLRNRQPASMTKPVTKDPN